MKHLVISVDKILRFTQDDKRWTFFLLKFIFFVFLFFFAVNSSIAQTDTSSIPTQKNSFNKKRLAAVVGVEVALYAGTLVILNDRWYKDYAHSSFHSFNDNSEWLQMDKVGHMTTSYNVGRFGIDLMKWSGVSRKKAIWYGGMLGSLFMSTVEILDGYSTAWGFSIGDIGANTAGSLIVIAQELAWDEQRFVLKYSFHQSEYAKYSPNLLGHNSQEHLLKDYNGQTYWLSCNLSSFMKKETKFPRWLNVAVGYGANGMIGGKYNPVVYNDVGNQIYFDRYRQLYLSLDVDLTRIKTRSKLLKTVFNTIGFIKIPAPALEFSKYGVKGSWLGF